MNVASQANSDNKVRSQVGGPSIVNVQTRRYESSQLANNQMAVQAAAPPAPALDNERLKELLDLMQNIDQNVAACATNLATMERAVEGQNEVIKQLNDTLEIKHLLRLG